MFFFKPAWMSKNSEKALNAVKKLSDQAKLYEIAKNAPLSNVREEAAQKLNNQSELLDIAKNGWGSALRCCAIKKLTDQAVLAEIATNQKDNDSIARGCAVSMLTDETKLIFIALNDKHPDICITAFKKITNRELIAQIASALYSPAQEPALLALKLDDSSLLPQVYLKIAKNTSHNSVHDPKEILSMIDNNEMLADIARHALSHHIKREAVLKITDQRVLENLGMAKCGTASLEAIARLTNQVTLAEIIRACQYEYKIVHAAIEKLTDKSLMDDLIQDQALQTWVRIKIADKISDQSLIQDFYKDIVSNTREPGFIRLRAAKKIQDKAFAQSIYADIVHTGEDWSIRYQSIWEISDENILASIAKSSSNGFKYSRNIEFDNIDHAISIECDLRDDIVSHLKNYDVISDIAKNAADKEIRSKALQKLNSMIALK